MLENTSFRMDPRRVQGGIFVVLLFLLSKSNNPESYRPQIGSDCVPPARRRAGAQILLINWLSEVMWSEPSPHTDVKPFYTSCCCSWNWNRRDDDDDDEGVSVSCQKVCFLLFALLHLLISSWNNKFTSSHLDQHQRIHIEVKHCVEILQQFCRSESVSALQRLVFALCYQSLCRKFFKRQISHLRTKLFHCSEAGQSKGQTLGGIKDYG